jgi:hypothetical protein
MCDPTSSYATAGIAMRVSGALIPHHHDKVETPSVGMKLGYEFYWDVHVLFECNNAEAFLKDTEETGKKLYRQLTKEISYKKKVKLSL